MPARPAPAKPKWKPPPRVAAARATIPSVDDLIAEAIRDLQSKGLTDEKVKADFGSALVEVEHAIEALYRTHERLALERLANEHHALIEAIPSGPEHAEERRKAHLALASDVKDFEFSGGQARKARGGSTWEKIGPQLLDHMGIPSEKPTGEDARALNQIDRVVPSVAVARDTPDLAVFVSFKRTFREKWRVLIDESRLGHLYLVSMGDRQDMSEDRIREMETKRIILFVPREVKNSTTFFQGSRALREFNDLPRALARFQRATG